MTSWAPYLWKEFRQSRRLALAALGVFLGVGLLPPIIAHIHRGVRRYDDDAILGIIEFGGPILAVLAGVYATGREQGVIEPFWRSRPINLNRWLMSKYIVGLVTVWLTCWIPLLTWMILVKTVSNADHPLVSRANIILVVSLVLSLIYSVSFVLGQCVRGAFPAMLLSVGAMALILVMPLVVRPLNWLSVDQLRRASVGSMDAPSYIAFITGVAVLCLGLLWLAGVLLKRGVQVDADQRVLSWSVVAILLVLAGGIAFPMGTNLPAQQVIPLPVVHYARVGAMAAGGNDVVMLLSDGPERSSGRERRYGLLRAHIGGQTSAMGEPLWFISPGQEPNLSCAAVALAWSPEEPSLAYVIVKRTESITRKHTSALYSIALDAGQGNPVIHQLELHPLLDSPDAYPAACLYHGQLYIYNSYPKARLLVFSLANPEAPVLVRNETLNQRIGYYGPGLHRGTLQQDQIRLAPIADANDLARVEVTHQLAGDYWVPVGRGKILASASDPREAAMRLALLEIDSAQDNVAFLHPTAYRQASAIEKFFRLSYGDDLYSSGPLAYRLSGSLGVTVYDISHPSRIERVGHYAAGEGFSTLVPLPNNRVVIAGQKLHVLDLSGKVSR